MTGYVMYYMALFFLAAVLISYGATVLMRVREIRRDSILSEDYFDTLLDVVLNGK